LATLQSASVTGGSGGELFDSGRGEVCERVAFEIGPDQLHRIELRRIGRKPLDVKATMATDEAGNRTAAMDAEAVPDQYDWTFEVTEEVVEKVDDPRDVDVSVCGEGEVQSYVAPSRRYRQRPNDRSLFPMAATLIQNRGLTTWRPGPPHQRGGEQTTLVQEDQMGIQPRGVFFTRFQSTLTQRWIASSSRSRARRSGFCAVQPSECSNRPMWST